MCWANGRVNDGTRRSDGSPQPNRRLWSLVVDHIEPHKGNWEAFWSGPFQTLCHDHHVGPKQQAERIGYSTEIGADGLPVDPMHPANR
jgi:hypothetical protein